MDQQEGAFAPERPRRTAATMESPERARKEWQENIIRGVAVVALIYAVHWIIWRWTSTLNTDPEAIVFSLLLVLAETWGVINMGMLVFMVWRMTDRDPGPVPKGVSVDVFITNYDEPLEILRRTVIGAKAIRYPHRTYMLDDGKREDVRLMAEELGIGYIRRPDNSNAKAGNLNYAMSKTSGELILQFDADHVPLPNILDRMLGYFRDPKVAFVQSPQDFYNTDSFSHIVNEEGRRLWEENRIFYSLVQPGRDNWNSSFFCGSCGVLRRKAFEEIGGFQTQTVIEDMETSMVLHSRGWKTVYHDETLAYGLAPSSAISYHTQRLRWAQGSMQMLRKLNPLTYPGLTPAQRLNYFAGTSTYFEGYQKVIFYLMPLLYLFTGIMPIKADPTEFLTRFVPYLVLMIASFELLSRGTGYILFNERYTMTRFYTYMVAVTAYFTRKKLAFAVTPKGKTDVPFWTYRPQLILLVLSVGAPIWATFAFHYGWVHYFRADGWGSIAFWLNGIWALWNCHFALFVVRHSLRMQQQRGDHRFAVHMPVRLRVPSAESPRLEPALVCDINPYGLGARSTTRLEPGEKITATLPLSTGDVEITGEVIHVTEQGGSHGPVYLHGIRYDEMPVSQRDRIEVHCTQHAVPIWRQRFRQSIDLMTRVSELMKDSRSERRTLVQLPARVQVHEEDGRTEQGLCLLEETSRSGARLLLDQPLAPGTRISYGVPGTDLSGTGVTRFVRTLETPGAIRFEIGVELDGAEQPARGWFSRLMPGRSGRDPVPLESTIAA